LRIVKNRYSGETGFAGKIRFNLETSQFTDYETKEPPIFNPATDF